MKNTLIAKGNYFELISRKGEIHLPIKDFFYKIVTIGLFDVEVIDYLKNPAQVEKFISVSIADLSPIVLNSDWFMYFDFHKSYNYWVKEGFFIIINTDKDVETYYVKLNHEHTIQFKYVHELQNFFKLIRETK